jgi:hypothetical protein
MSAGDDASGPIHYSTDLSRPFSKYVLTKHDEDWSNSLITRLHYGGRAIHFVRTSLSLTVDKTTLQGAVYEAVEKPELFYVVSGDAILQLGTRWAYNPGVAGFSMHAPPSLNFIVCLNLHGGVPFLSSTPVVKGTVNWTGHSYTRFPEPRQTNINTQRTGNL